MTVEKLNRVWTADASKQVSRWSDPRPGWPDEWIHLYGPGLGSGTFDCFVEVVIHPYDGSGSKGHGDDAPSEDDNVLVKGVGAGPYGLGCFGLAYYEESKAKLRAVPIADKDGAKGVEPSAETIEKGRAQAARAPHICTPTASPPARSRSTSSGASAPRGRRSSRRSATSSCPPPSKRDAREGPLKERRPAGARPAPSPRPALAPCRYLKRDVAGQAPPRGEPWTPRRERL